MTDRLRRAVLSACAALLLAHGVQGAQPVSAAAAASSPTLLDTYLAGLNTWSADFTQSAVNSRNESVGGSQGSGRLVIARPGRFRLEMRSEGAREPDQITVADGRDLWSYEVELEQVVVRPVKDQLPQSPAMLLAGNADVRKAFDVTAAGRSTSLDWVRAVPKDASSEFREARFGFNGKELARIVVDDKLGQTLTLVFRNVRRNAPVDPKLLVFTPPAGVDVIGKPSPVP